MNTLKRATAKSKSNSRLYASLTQAIFASGNWIIVSIDRNMASNFNEIALRHKAKQFLLQSRDQNTTSYTFGCALQ